MPTSYQTSATPRGGRRKEDSEKQTSSKASHEGLNKLSKKTSRPSERTAPAVVDRPTSPVSVISSRSAPTERNTLPKHPSLYSPSTMSLTSQRSLPYLVDEAQMTLPTTIPSPEDRYVRQPPTLKETVNESSTCTVSQTPTLGSASNIVKQALPSPVSDVSPARKHPPQSNTAEGFRALQPNVEDVLEEGKPTATPTKPLSSEQISADDLHPTQFSKNAVEEKRSNHGLEKIASKTSQSSLPATPAMSPRMSPRMQYDTETPVDYSNMSPTLPHYPYPYPPNMAIMPGSGPMYANPYYNIPYSPPFEQRQPYDASSGGYPARIAGEDHHENLLQKVSDVLPDIHRLLNEYKETHGQLSAKEMLVQRSEKEHEEKISRLKIELDANKKEYEKVIQSLVSDCAKLEREATDLRQQVANLQTITEAHGKMQMQVATIQESHKELEARVETLQRTKEELLLSKEAQDKELQDSRNDHLRQMMEVQKLHKEALAAKEKEHQQALSEQKNLLSKTQLDLAGLISKHANLKNDLEVSRSLQNEHKIQLDAKMKELDDARARHAKEIELIEETKEEDRRRNLNKVEAQNAKVIEDHNHKEQKWMQDLEAAKNEIQKYEKDLAKERKELQALRVTRKREQEQTSELAFGMASWKAKHAELHKEHEKVDRLLQSLRPVVEAKPKGDGFFIEAFHKLASSIKALSVDLFYDTPPALPRDILRLIPTGMPDFTGRTDAARQLRAFYIEHKIFNVLIRRIFQPFLFALECRCGGVDRFLQGLSAGIRSKSERREAVWRQITLRSAYAGAQGKEATHRVVHETVEEILREVKWFTDKDKWPSLTSSLRFVVKVAVELWRYARLERELVTISTPDATAGLGKPERHEMDRKSSQAGRDPQRTVVLPVTPCVAREAIHKDHLLSLERPEPGGVIFLHELALYADSEIIITRRREIMSAQESSKLSTHTA